MFVVFVSLCKNIEIRMGTFSQGIAEDIIRVRLGQLLVNEEHKAGKLKIPVHLAFGHETIAVAVDHVLKNEDKLVLTHRNIAYHLARLKKLRPILREYFLDSTGIMCGKLGSMNVINPACGVIYTSSILGNNFPVSIGLATAEKIFKKSGIVCVLGGDGSIEEGSFYESLLMSKAIGIGLLFIIENNEWSLGTHITERRRPIDLKKLVEAVGGLYSLLEGNDFNKYAQTLLDIREDVLRGAVWCVEVCVKTLGDKHLPPSHEFPKGKHINYHAGPATAISIATHFPLSVLQEDVCDPIFVLCQKLGKETVKKLSQEVMQALRQEFV